MANFLSAIRRRRFHGASNSFTRTVLPTETWGRVFNACHVIQWRLTQYVRV
jgi:hypothetical protein